MEFSHFDLVHGILSIIYALQWTLIFCSKMLPLTFILWMIFLSHIFTQFPLFQSQTLFYLAVCNARGFLYSPITEVFIQLHRFSFFIYWVGIDFWIPFLKCNLAVLCSPLQLLQQYMCIYLFIAIWSSLFRYSHQQHFFLGVCLFCLLLKHATPLEIR